MSKLRKLYSGQTKSVIETKSLLALKEKTGNIYKSIAVISKRANQINVSTKQNYIVFYQILKVITTIRSYMKIKNKLKFQKHMKNYLIPLY